MRVRKKSISLCPPFSVNALGPPGKSFARSAPAQLPAVSYVEKDPGLESNIK